MVRNLEPDSKATAIYSYYTESGRLQGQKVRMPGKKFLSRKPVRGGYKYDDVKLGLYNVNLLEHARVAILAESEKDADAINNALKLHEGVFPDIVAVATGGANKWKDEYGDKSLNKQVIINPHDDESGQNLAMEIMASLKARLIHYRLVKPTNGKDIAEEIHNFVLAKFGLASLLMEPEPVFLDA